MSLVPHGACSPCGFGVAEFAMGVLVGATTALVVVWSCRAPLSKKQKQPTVQVQPERERQQADTVTRCMHGREGLVRMRRNGMFELMCRTCGMLIVREPEPVSCEHSTVDYSGTNQHGPRLRCVGCKKLLVKAHR